MANRVQRIYVIIILLLIFIPLLVVTFLSFNSSRYLDFSGQYTLHWYEKLITEEKWINAFWVSTRVALFSSLLSTMLSLLLVLGLEYYRSGRRKLLFLLLSSPMMMPMIVLGVAFYFWFSELNLIESISGLVVAHTLITTPVSLWVISDFQESMNPNLEKAAFVLGSTWLEFLVKVKLKLLSPSIFVALLLSFIVSFDEPVIALFISGTYCATLPKVMWDGIRYEIDPTLNAAAVVMMLLSILIVVCVFALSNRKISLIK